ncbi:hypothetical protein ACFPM0_30475 [Pseudonocardia sulfidoxydans]|uniref:hypothetical protein n=1 Tax=Pseudonocardia sulfidoxydans TaxID=54011 RepID=UPI00361C8F28
MTAVNAASNAVTNAQTAQTTERRRTSNTPHVQATPRGAAGRTYTRSDPLRRNGSGPVIRASGPSPEACGRSGAAP